MQFLKEKLNMGVGLAMIILIIPGLFAFPGKSEAKPAHRVLAKEEEKASSHQQAYKDIPTRPLSLKELTAYKDADLKEKAGTISKMTQLNIRKLTKGAFELSDGRYIRAVKEDLASDVLISKENIDQTVYTSAQTKVYYNPYTSFDKEVYSQLPKGQSYSADKLAKTLWGSYYEISFDGGQTGWVSADDLSLKNPKMLALQDLLNKKYNSSDYSIYVKELDSKFTVGINQNQTMYSASLSKLPILYWTQKRINDGQANLSDQLYYSSVINGFPGSFEPAGTGVLSEIPDEKNYSLLEVINVTAKDSDNVGSNLLAYYETKQFSQEYQDAITKLAGRPWNPSKREASAEMVGRVLEGLYNEGGAGFNSLFNTAFDNIKIKAGVPSNIKVAHKIGAADSYNHDAAIVFAEHPYILVVESSSASDQEIADISKDVYGALE
ncbi:serine hydrolase [Lactococcus termiticola]|uniref:Beta-lactamase class A n=1 Tax=Lactococcus termiticola TaxID=2169526 RepID=A0A2R5HHP6_9LACT|nr:serine hydrolase [Lactococcus termiticola]GBG96875.1 beta-lactamase class A [Lactococcus termiticola]